MENNLDLYIFADESYEWIFKELEETIQDVLGILSIFTKRRVQM